MKRTLSLYIIREISSLFLLGITVFTLVLLMSRMIRLTEMIVSHGVPLVDVCRMILYLMPSFLIFTIPMAFLLSVLLAFGRLSADNEITVMKASGISLTQIMPPVMFCGLVATAMTLAASIAGVPAGNTAFKELSFQMLKQHVTATIREKVFWDEIPGIVIYTDQYDEQQRALQGVIIHDGRNPERSLTIFARNGTVAGGDGHEMLRLKLHNGTIHSPGSRKDEYRLVHFDDYLMAVVGPKSTDGVSRNELDMSVTELLTQSNRPDTDKHQRLKLLAEFHSRFSFPCASIVFAIIAVPLGIRNRRSGKSAGFSASLGILLAYYLLLSFAKALAEKGSLPPLVALWLPNVLFLAAGLLLFKMASHDRQFSLPGPDDLLRLVRRKGV